MSTSSSADRCIICGAPLSDPSDIECTECEKIPPSYDTISVETLEGGRRFRTGKYGEFAMLPDHLPAGPPPAVIAFSHWTTPHDTRLRRRAGADGNDYLDLEHEGRTWTYRLSSAFSAHAGERGFFLQSEAFDVGVLPD